MRMLKIAFLRGAKSLGLFSLARLLTRGKLRILCYHGMAIDDQAQFRPYLYMSTEVFRERMTYLSRAGYRIIDLDSAIQQLHAGTLAPDSVVITADDGWHGFYRLAVPVLKDAGFAATIYVTTYHVTHSTPVFGLVIQYMFWKTREEQIHLSAFPFLSATSCNLADQEVRESLLQKILAYGEACDSEAERVSLSRTLGEILKVSYDEIVRKRMFHLMTPDELRTASAAGMKMELHTHRHRFPAADEDAATREIIENRQVLHDLTGSTGRHFCYPSGVWDQRQWAWLDRLEIRSSTTCLPGLNSSSTPHHALRRFLDGETVHALEFEAALSGFMDMVRSVLRRSAPAGRD